MRELWAVKGKTFAFTWQFWKVRQTKVNHYNSRTCGKSQGKALQESCPIFPPKTAVSEAATEICVFSERRDVLI
jgi:hypothetical protein